MTTFDYDLVTIGAGSGGVAASRRAAAHGARVAIVEGRRIGGTCVLRGCVPKKLLSYAAGFADEVRVARGYGWSVDEPRFDAARWQAAKAAELDRLEQVYRTLLSDSGVELLPGWARVENPHEVQLEGWSEADFGSTSGTGGAARRIVTARHVLIATGSSPVRDSIPGIEACATSDDLLDLAELPASAAFVGSGYVAVEFASMFARLGVEVSMFYRDTLPLRGFDALLRKAAATSLAASGVHLHPGRAPERIEPAGDGWRLHLPGGAEHVAPWVLNATGRRPNTAGMAVALSPTKGIAVDEHLQTSLPGVYAIGDVTSRVNLTPVAIADGRALVDALFGPEHRPVDLRRIPTAVFLHPPIGTVGPTEEQLVASRRDFAVYETSFRSMKTAFVGAKDRTEFKLLVDPDEGTVLAVHLSGADAPEIIQCLAVALTAGARKADFDRTLAVHPTLSEELVLLRAPSRVWRASEGPRGP